MNSRMVARVVAVMALLVGGMWLWRISGGVAPSSTTRDAPADARVPHPSATQEATAAQTRESEHGQAGCDGTFSPSHPGEIPAPIVAFSDWLATWRQSGSESHVALASRGRQLAMARRAALKEMIASDPRQALEQAIPRSLRAELPAEVVAELEVPVDAFGRLEVIAICFGAESRIDRRVVVGEQSYAAYVYGRRLEALTKSNLAIHGIAIDDRLAVSEAPYRYLEADELARQGESEGALTVAVGDRIAVFATDAELAAWGETVGAAEASTGPNVSADPLTPQAAPSSWVIGEKTVLWIRVDFSDEPGLVASDQQITDTMTEVSEYYRDISRNRCWFKTTIVPDALRLVGTKESFVATGGSEYSLWTEALNLARAYDTAHGGAGTYNPDRYDRTIVIFRSISSFHFGGLGYIGATGIWLNGTTDSGVVAHELGHNQGLSHSHAWQPTGTSPINPGTHEEYGDTFDIMGASGSMPHGHFNAKQKASLQYLAPAEVSTATSGGVYRIYRHDTRSAAGAQAVTVAAGAAYDYWIEYRQQVPSDYFSYTDRLRNGLVLHWGKRPSFTSGTGTYLLDSTPISAGGMSDAPLALGETFTDPDYGINITPLATDGAEPNQWIDVAVSLGATGSNHNPEVALSALSGTLAARTDITFSATGSDPDGDTVYYRWDFGDGRITPLTGTATHRWLIGGTYDVSVSAIDAKGGLATKTLAVNVADPLLSWTRRASGLAGANLKDVTWSGGRFVAVGNNSAVVSPDGASWTQAGILGGPNVHSSYGVAFGAGRYVTTGEIYGGAGYVGSVACSTDGITWQAGTLPVGAASLRKVAFGAGRFVAVGMAGKIYNSADGAIWSESASGISENLQGIAYADGLFVAVGARGRILSSSDGVTWSNCTPANATSDFTGVARLNGLWCAASDYDAWTSSDAGNWGKAFGSYRSVLGVGTGAGGFLAPGYGGKLSVSGDGVTWTSLSPIGSAQNSLSAVAEGNGTVVLVGDSGLICQSGTPTLLAPVLRNAAALGQVSAGELILLPVDANGFAKLELLVDGSVVSEIAGIGEAFNWTPSRFGRYTLAVRGTLTGGATLESAPIQVLATLGGWVRRNPLTFGETLNGAAWLDGKWWLCGAGGTIVCDDPGGDASIVDSGTGADLLSIAAGAGRLVAVGSWWDVGGQTTSSPIRTSTDGVNWIPWTPTSQLHLYSVAWARGLWVTVGYSGQILTSPDGLVWTTRPSGTSATLRCVAGNGSLWVAVGDGGTILTSLDGVTWTGRASGTSNWIWGIAFLNNRWVTVGEYGEIRSSDDGISWTTRASGTASSLQGVGVFKGEFVAVGDGATVVRSTDGIAWAPAASTGSGWRWRGASADAGQCIVFGEQGDIATTADLTTWVRLSQGSRDTRRAVLYAGGRYVVASEGWSSGAAVVPLMTSTNGIRWNSGSGVPSGMPLNALSYGQATYLAVGDRGGIYTSSDAAIWMQRTSGLDSSRNLYAAASSPDLHIAAGSSGCLVTSPDGETWTARTSGVTAGLFGACFGNGLFVVVGENGIILTSSDGLNWTPRRWVFGSPLLAVTWADGVGFVAVGAAGTVLVSGDGITWAVRATGVGYTFAGVANTSSGLVALGSNGQVLLSADGVNWVAGRLPTTQTVYGMAVGPSSMVAVGANGVVLRRGFGLGNRADFNCDGNADLLWQNPATGERRIWLMNGLTKTGEVALATEAPAWRVAAAADFDGDGQSDLLWANTVTGEHGFWEMDGITRSRWVPLGLDSPIWQVVAAADFNRDGMVDLVWENTSTGARRIWLMNHMAKASDVSLGTIDRVWQIAGASDFNGDHQSDLLWRNSSTGELTLWLMRDTVYLERVPLGTAAADWQIGGVADLDGDGRSDVLWENATTGERGVWLMQGTSFGSWVPWGVVDLGWRLSPRARTRLGPDCNGDGQFDLLWQNANTGERRAWLMDGVNRTADLPLATIDPSWRIAAAADFNGDGRTDFLWADSITGEHGFAQMSDTSFEHWVPLVNEPRSWEVVATGDFNGDGMLDLVWENAVTGACRVWLLSNMAKASEVSLGSFALVWQIAGAADFDGDGQSDLLWQNTATGERAICLMHGTTFGEQVSLGVVPTAWQSGGVVDLNGDGQPDILWENTATGERGAWLMQGTSFGSWVSLGTIDPQWRLAARAQRAAGPDCNGDGQPDILWRNTATDECGAWLMQGTSYSAWASFGSVSQDWELAGAGDFDADGQSDLVWQNSTTGERRLWLMRNCSLSTSVPLGTVATAWNIAVVGDADGDGRPDLVWENTTTGERCVWLMNGSTYTRTINLGIVANDWRIVGVADFNGDTAPDLVWENTVTGARVIWLMNGETCTASAELGFISTDWRVAGTGDFNGDGHPDFLWENPSTGARVIWFMNGTTYTGWADLGFVSTDWHIRN